MARGDVFHIRYDMCGNQDDPVPGEFRQEVAEPHPLPWIQAGGRFIQNQDLRVIQQRLGNAHPPSHTAGQMSDFFPGGLCQGYLIQQLFHPLPAGLFVQSFQGCCIEQIVPDGKFRRKPEVLRQES